jgi:hypothetical protein
MPWPCVELDGPASPEEYIVMVILSTNAVVSDVRSSSGLLGHCLVALVSMMMVDRMRAMTIRHRLVVCTLPAAGIKDRCDALLLP